VILKSRSMITRPYPIWIITPLGAHASVSDTNHPPLGVLASMSYPVPIQRPHPRDHVWYKVIGAHVFTHHYWGLVKNYDPSVTHGHISSINYEMHGGCVLGLVFSVQDTSGTRRLRVRRGNRAWRGERLPVVVSWTSAAVHREQQQLDPHRLPQR